MNKTPFLKYFTIYSLIAFIFTGTAMVLFVSNYIKNDKINSIAQLTNLTLYYTVEPNLSSSDYLQTLSKEKANILDSKLKHVFAKDDISGVNIWNNSNVIIYSSNNNIIPTSIYIIVKDDTKYLVKSGRSNHEKESSHLEHVTECICYELAKLMQIDCAEYKLENETLFSFSKWFYNEEERFYSANKLMRILHIHRENLYNKLIEAFPQIKMDLNNIIVFDYIVNNSNAFN
jgi:hypothetical protein